MFNTAEDDSGVIYVEGSAYRMVPYDRMRITITFKSIDTDAFKTAETVLKQSEEFLAILKEANFNLSTLTFDADMVGSRRYSDDKESTSERSFKIDTQYDIDLVNYFDALIIEHRWDASSSLYFYVSNEEEVMRELQQEAIQNSKRDADSAAAAAGHKVKGLLSMDLREIDFAKYCSLEVEYELESPKLYSSELSVQCKKLSTTVRVKWAIE